MVVSEAGAGVGVGPPAGDEVAALAAVRDPPEVGAEGAQAEAAPAEGPPGVAAKVAGATGPARLVVLHLVAVAAESETLLLIQYFKTNKQGIALDARIMPTLHKAGSTGCPFIPMPKSLYRPLAGRRLARNTLPGVQARSHGP